MKTDSLVLIPYTEYGVPSGNYDGSSETSFTGDRQKGVTYYLRNKSHQSVRFTCDDFVGTIKIQMCLDSDPSDDDNNWVTLYTFPTDDSSSLDGSTAISADYSVSITARSTWVRAVVNSFTGGTINSVKLSY